MILGIDTATRTCGVALWDSERHIAVGKYVLTLKKHVHSTRLLPMIQTLMQECGVERGQVRAIAVTEGPGSFTGVRIGVTAAKSLAYAWNVPVVPVSTLKVLLAGVDVFTAGESGPGIGALMDARHHRCYTLVQDQGGRHIIEPGQYALEEIAELVKLSLGIRRLVLTGSGARAYEAELAELLAPDCTVELAPRERHQPDPAVLCRLAAPGVSGDHQEHSLKLVPRYLRRSSAERERSEREGGDSVGSSTDR